MTENQYAKFCKDYRSHIDRVREDLSVGRSPSTLADSLHAQGLGPLQIIGVFREATGASLGDLKSFSRWWGPEGVTDAQAFDEWAAEVLKG